MTNDLHLLDGYVVTMAPATAQAITHPLGDGTFCRLHWRKVGVNGQEAPGAVTAPCVHKRVFATPDLPLVVITHVLDRDRIERQAAAEQAEAAGEIPPLPSLVARR